MSSPSLPLSRRPLSHHLGLQVIAGFKVFQSLLLFGVSWGLFRLIHVDLEEFADKFIAGLPIHNESLMVQHLQERFSALTPETLHHLAIGTFLYASLFLAEGIGLWLEKSWAESLVIVTTSFFIPFEIGGLWRHPDLLHLGMLICNLLILGYVTKMLLQKWRRKKSESWGRPVELLVEEKTGL